MESLIDSQHGTTALMAGLIVILSLHLVMKLAEFWSKVLQKKSEITEKSIENLKQSIENLKQSLDNLSSFMSGNTEAVHRLEERMRAVETQITEASKIKIDIRRLFLAIKVLAGDQWTDLKKSITEDDFHN